ncbi:MAG: DsbA family protein [Rhodospirillaceae bacterium]|jgi:protein-disulfide isomerase|nr:DsbA family protein [Rhodospirillaceae bacterium]MBT4487429.1 DsbA family protein [Rhodospirillaceae bacterium]MBT5191425.1 DsbA family protein [Rhodospirillaceae bacterium]MBT5895076.1 DsbA family protein [Rhodospirillaceae bacterium]MBT6427789.1 DsbA family protein [Rhodospirillaceae bacterium]
MAFALLRRFVLVLSFAAAIILPAMAQAQQSKDPETTRIEQIIRNYLLENPELLVEVMQKLERRQKAKEQEDRISAIKKNRKALFASTNDHIVNPMGRIPVVEFFDYQCGYCKKFLPNVVRLLKSDKSVRFIFKEFPILGEASVVASRAALAAKMQGKYLAYHNALMGLRRGLTETLVFQIAEDIGLDVARLKTDMESPEISRIIDENRKLARSMGIRGTPTIVVGEQMAPGAVSYSRLTALIEDARKNCSVC